MDLVLELYGKKETLGGTIPTTINESNIAFEHVAGFSNWVIDGTHVKAAKAGCHYLTRLGFKPSKDQEKILPIFKKRYSDNCRNAGQPDLGAIEALLRILKASENKALRKNIQRKSGRRGYRKEKKHNSSKFSITQLLSVLERGLQLETTSIRFDYVSMHLRCLRIFRDVKQVCDPYLAARHGAGYIKNNSLSPSITGWILKYAGHTDGKQARGMKLNNGNNPRRLLLRASEVFRQILGTGEEGQEETLKVVEHRRR